MTAGLARFNAADHGEACRLLLSCAAVPRWAEKVASGRPYPDVESALRAARTASDPWTTREVDAALSQHPRIGEAPTSDDDAAAHSRREQAAVDGADPALADRLRAGNRAYEERFGHVFLIRAAGRTPEQILAALTERLGNDPATERRVAAAQLREIAVLRLEGEFA